MMKTWLLCLLLTATPVYANPVTATCEGWLTQDQFDALGSCTWSMPADMPFFMFRNDVVSHDSAFDQEEFSYVSTVVNGTKWVTVYAFDIGPRCGTRQFDAGYLAVSPDKSLGLTNLNSCSPDSPPPPYEPPSGPPPPNAPQVPEPASLVLLSAGLLLARAGYLRQHGRV